MATITLRVTDTKADKLKKLAEKMNVSVNKLLDELTTVAITNEETQTRFQIRAARGNRQRGLETLDKLDSYFANNKPEHAPSSLSVHETGEPFDYKGK